MKACSDCYRNFYHESDVKVGSACPAQLCQGYIFELDDNIYYAIRNLNKKGYITIESCSGHTTGSNYPYITFNETINLKSFSYLPTGFKTRLTEKGNIKIFARIPSSEPLKRQRLIMESSINLIIWAETIPSVKTLVIQLIINELDWSKNESQIMQQIYQRFNLITPKINREIREGFTMVEYEYHTSSDKVKTITEKFSTYTSCLIKEVIVIEK